MKVNPFSGLALLTGQYIEGIKDSRQREVVYREFASYNVRQVRQVTAILPFVILLFFSIPSFFSYSSPIQRNAVPLWPLVVLHASLLFSFPVLKIISNSISAKWQLGYGWRRVYFLLFVLNSLVQISLIGWLGGYWQASALLFMVVPMLVLAAFYLRFSETLTLLLISLAGCAVSLFLSGLSLLNVAFFMAGVLFLIAGLVLQSRRFDAYRLQKQSETQIGTLLWQKGELQKSSDQLEHFFKHLPQGFFRLESGRGLVYANNQLARMFGYRDAAELKQNSLLFSMQLQYLHQLTDSARAPGKQLVQNYEHEFRRRDGLSFNGLLNAAIIQNLDTGEVIYEGSLTDVTESSREDALATQLGLAAGNMQVSLTITDREGQITWANDAFSRLVGYRLAEVKGRKFTSLLSGEKTNTDILGKIQLALARTENFSGELLRYRKDGTQYWAKLDITPVRLADGTLQFITEETDITRLKTMEEELIEAKENIISAYQTKERFFSMVSHELRTPLTAVLGITHKLMSSDPRQDQVPHLKTLKTSGERLLELINDILDSSKIQAGKITFEKVPFSLNELLQNQQQLFGYQAEEKGLSLLIDVDSKLPDIFLGDPVRLSQILTNLLSNAIKFTSEGYVRVGAKVLSMDSEMVSLQFSVRDTGVGIPANKQETIFQAFEQASFDTTRNYGGTGLGLSITKQLVEMQGGTITVESKPGAGSVFVFHLHMNYEQAGKQDGQLAAGLSRDHVQDDYRLDAKVLVVDDNEINLQVAQTLLSDWGIEVFTAISGKKGLKLAAKEQFDLVFMDLQMDDMNGVEATAALRELPAYKEVPVIALSATAETNRATLLEEGFNDFLAKPYKPEAMQLVLSKFLDSAEAPVTPITKTPDPEPVEVISASIKDDLLAELIKISNGDEAFIEKVIDLYAKQFKQLPVDLRTSMDSLDMTNIRRLLHKMKPSLKLLKNAELEGAIKDLSALLDSTTEPYRLRIKMNRLIGMIEDLEQVFQERQTDIKRNAS